MKFIAKILYFFIITIDNFFYLLVKKNLRYLLYDFLRQSYSSVNIRNRKIIFFTPSSISKWRVNTIFNKEPETIKFIDTMKGKKVFFDIGANIGLYSVYAAIKKPNIKVFSFEPSTANLSLLARNISINNLTKRVSIIQLPLGKRSIGVDKIREGFLDEGGSMNAFGVSYGFNGKKIQTVNDYKILGSSLDYLIKIRAIPQPDYIKLDVDGIEHLILEGSLKCLKNKKLKKIIIEINENFKSQYMKILKILNANKFKVIAKERAEEFYNSKKFKKTFNYIFTRN